MSVKLCRLCLNNDRLIHMFDGRLNSQQQLRTCILLGTGVDIQPDDIVSKHVCHNCCIIAVKLFKYRQNAIASDRALKDYINQKSEEVPLNKEEIAQLHRSLIEDLTKTDLKWSPDDHEDVAGSTSDTLSRNLDVKSKSTKGNSAVHTSVRKLFNRFPKIVIPNEVLPFNIEPTVGLKKERIHDLLHRIKSEKNTNVKVSESNLEAIDRLKQSCPSLNIVRIKTSADKDDRHELRSNSPGTSTIRRDTTLRHPVSFKAAQIKRKRTSSSNSQESFEAIKVKRRRITSNESESNDMMCTSPHTMLDGDEEDHNYFPTEFSQAANSESKCENQNTTSVPSTSINNPEEEEVNHAVSLCNFCGRIYDCEDELKLHEDRMHPVCHVCKERQKSPTGLSAHLNEVCYKNIETNQPKLELIRVNEIPELRQKYKKSFDYLLDTDAENTDDDDPVEIVNEFDYMNETEFDEIINAAITPSEHEHLFNTFMRYAKSESFMKSKYTRMQMSNIKIRYDAKNRIIIENLYPDLKIFKVPLSLKVASKVAAHVSTAPKAKIDDSKDTWDASKAIDVKPKYNYVVTNSLDMPSLVVTDTPTTSGNIQQNFLVLQPNSVAQTSGVTCATPKYIFKQNPSKNVKVPVKINRILSKSILKKPEGNTNSSVINGINLREFFVPKQSNVAATQQQQSPQIRTTSAPVQKYSAKIIVNTNQPKPTEVCLIAPAPAKPTTSDKPMQTGQSLLRVKAPWEINSQLLKQ